MTDAQKLEAIKAELEKLQNIYSKDLPKYDRLGYEGKRAILKDLQDFIAALDEQSEEKMKEFNVEEYYKNPERKVVTRDGREVEILKIDTKTKTNVPVIAMMDGYDIRFFTTNGRLSLERETCSDLFFVDDNCTNDTNTTDYTKSNEEKAKEICGKGNPCCNKLCQNCCLSFVIADVKQMAEWKDEQFKQDLYNAFHSADHVQYMNGYNKAVEKAEDWLYEHSREYNITAKALHDFHEAMRGEQQ